VLVEIQALLAPSAGGSPRRSVVGWDSSRLSMLLAVLESRCGLSLGANDVYLNIAGGLRINEPAADLAVAAALCSAATDRPTESGTVYFGEVGLSGEVRQVSQAESRLREAKKLGFGAAVLPRRLARAGRAPAPADGLKLNEVGHLADLVAPFAEKTVQRRATPKAAAKPAEADAEA
jgi:DNA repair protein RadA/Sms